MIEPDGDWVRMASTSVARIDVYNETCKPVARLPFAMSSYMDYPPVRGTHAPLTHERSAVSVRQAPPCGKMMNQAFLEWITGAASRLGWQIAPGQRSVDLYLTDVQDPDYEDHHPLEVTATPSSDGIQGVPPIVQFWFVAGGVNGMFATQVWPTLSIRLLQEKNPLGGAFMIGEHQGIYLASAQVTWFADSVTDDRLRFTAHLLLSMKDRFVALRDEIIHEQVGLR